MSVSGGSKSSKVAFLVLVTACLVIPAAAMASSATPGKWTTPISQDTTGADTTAAKPDSATIVPPPPPAPTVTTPAPAATPTPPPAAASATATTAAPAAAPTDAGMFSKGKKRVSVTAGWGSTFGDDYVLLGIGVGYFLRNGLDVGMDFEGWFLGEPTVYKLSPRADYVLWKAPRIKPYAGAFYRWNFITGGLDDLNSLGGRVGAFYKGSRGGMAGAGAVYERYLNADERVYDSADVWYPEIFFAVSF